MGVNYITDSLRNISEYKENLSSFKYNELHLSLKDDDSFCNYIIEENDGLRPFIDEIKKLVKCLNLDLE